MFIGFHTSVGIKGNVGSPARIKCSVTKPVVISDFRIEQLNKTYQTRMLISREVYDKLDRKKDNFQMLDDVEVKGREEPITLYKFIG